MVTSFQEICGVKVAIWISNFPEVKNQIFSASLNSLKHSSEYKTWIFALQKETSELLKNIPPGLVGCIPQYLVPLIGFQMLKWSKFHESHFNLTPKFCSEFIRGSYFTSKGTIDVEKTAKDLVKGSSLSPFLRYKIACYYFLSDIIPVLWRQFHDGTDGSKMKEMLIQNDYEETVVMWSEHLEKIQEFSLSASELNSETENFLIIAFRYGIEKENLAALKYCCKTVTKTWNIFSFTEKFRAENEGILHVSVYHNGWPCKLFEYQNFPYYEMLLSVELEKLVNILMFFLQQMKREEIKRFLIHFDISYAALRWFLSWPYQDLFLDVVDSSLFFDLEGDNFLDASDYYFLTKDIIELIEDPILGHTYNYRLLLKDFLIKSPSDFKERLRIHSDPSDRSFVYFISPTLLRLRNFTPEDEYNYRLILKHATSQTKNAIFHHRGEEICQELISRGNFALADFFLESLSLNDETIKTFKKSLAENYFVDVVMKEENIHLANYFVNWIVNPEYNEELKQEILSKIFKFSKITAFILQSKISLTFLNVILEWLLSTGEKIAEWKMNGIYDKNFGKTFIFEKYDPKKFDQFLEWITSYSKEKISDVKREILLQTLPEIAVDLFDEYRGLEVDEYYIIKVLYLCSNNKEITKEFVKVLHDRCKNLVEQKICLLCSDSNNVYFNKDKSTLYCSLHCTSILSFEDVDCVCSYILKSADDFLQVHIGE